VLAGPVELGGVVGEEALQAALAAQKFTRLAPVAGVLWSTVGVVPSVIAGYWLRSDTLTVPKCACSAALRPSGRVPAGLPPASHTLVFQVKLVRLLVAPWRNRKMLRSSQ
jgi:hypothetical protein